MKKELSFEEKLKIVRTKHLRWHPEAISQLESWENDMVKLRVTKEWLDNPITRQLRETAEQQVKMIESTLSLTENLPEETRVKLFQFKKAHLVYLALLTENVDSQMRTIESAIDEELSNDNFNENE